MRGGGSPVDLHRRFVDLAEQYVTEIEGPDRVLAFFEVDMVLLSGNREKGTAPVTVATYWTRRGRSSRYRPQTPRSISSGGKPPPSAAMGLVQFKLDA